MSTSLFFVLQAEIMGVGYQASDRLVYLVISVICLILSIASRIREGRKGG